MQSACLSVISLLSDFIQKDQYMDTANMTASPVRKPNPYDVHVGARLKACRTLAGFSQEKLGQQVNLSFQQIQKYEKGLNRIGASRLQQFAQILNVPPSYFFDGIDVNPTSQRQPAELDASAVLAAVQGDEVSQRKSIELVRNFGRIQDPLMRNAIANLVKTVALSYEAGAEPAGAPAGDREAAE